ncbi:MAG: B12-binding domain-containing radical SAM protein, partial [Candidatus Omnitrophica bacterium]|nr:B12-binding domain-containing radical SAM protein [Candidatus Omnitrophota bacterium]
LYPEFRSREPEHVLGEIQFLIEQYRVREVMDDTGCFPVGAWLEDFCLGVIKKGINKKIYLDCNMRFGALSRDQFVLMRKANFRLLLFGLESANQKTLDRINKKITVQQIIEDCKVASSVGLFPHITIMFGYPWESYDDALATLNLGKWLLKKGYAYTMQATIVQGMYKVSFSPEFMARRIRSLRDFDDIKYALRAAGKVCGHILDFGNRPHN